MNNYIHVKDAYINKEHISDIFVDRTSSVGDRLIIKLDNGDCFVYKIMKKEASDDVVRNHILKIINS